MEEPQVDKEQLFESLSKLIAQYVPNYQHSQCEALEKIDFETIAAFCTDYDLLNLVYTMKVFLNCNASLLNMTQMNRFNMIMYLYHHSLSTCVKQSIVNAQEDESYMVYVKQPVELFSDLEEQKNSNVSRTCACGSKNVYEFTQQGRSSDEAASLFMRCSDCARVKRIG